MKICFVSYEIHPTTPGGCGVFLHNAARFLLQQGHTVLFLLDIPAKAFEQFQQTDRAALPHADRCRAFWVEALCAGLPLTEADFDNEFLWRSFRVHRALEKLVAAESPDVVEFFDFTGVAFYALAAKVTRQQYAGTRLVVRLHNSLELIDRQEATQSHSPERYLAYALEHHALRLAETVLYPSESYLAKSYRPHYEPWLGDACLSKPPLLDHPIRPAPVREPDTVLFYGRLYNFKGVDLFVAAAVEFLYAHPETPLQFVLVGHDSRRAPDGSPTYQEFLRQKIPARFLDRFQFKGHLGWDELESLLARVQFAVLPGYFESFSYAAHELYAAGIPLILSDLPAYEGYFTHGENALLFDGTVSDLARHMARLAADGALRQKLAKPYGVTGRPLGDFYDAPAGQSWINPAPPAELPPRLLVVILAEDGQYPAATVASLAPHLPDGAQVVTFYPAAAGPGKPAAGTLEAVWLLGRSRRAFDAGGQPLRPAQITTADALLVLRAGDRLRHSYLNLCLDTLARQPEISFVGSWKQAAGSPASDLFPLDAAAELLPFRTPLRRLSRAVMRTRAGHLLVDLFDPRLAGFGEIGYLWQLEDEIGPGLLIPDVLIDSPPEPTAPPNPNLLSYLLLRDNSGVRQRRLARYLVSYFLQHDSNIPADLSDRVLAERLAAQLEELHATRGWRLLGKYWAWRDRIRSLLRHANPRDRR